MWNSRVALAPWANAINDGKIEWGIVFWTKAELKNLLTAGPVDIWRLELKGEIKGQPGSKSKPPDMSATLRLGPTLETKNKCSNLAPVATSAWR